MNGTTVDRLILKFSGEPDFLRALKLAQIVCQSPDQLPGITMSATHFTLVTEHPYWAKGEKPVAVIGRHAFYKLKRY